MSVAVDHRGSRIRSVAAALLAVLVLVPTGMLFARVFQDVSGHREDTRREQRGTEYLTALTPLVSALVETQSSALAGIREPSEKLTEAVAGAGAADSRLGGELRTHDRWNGLRDAIAGLPSTTGDPIEVYQKHVEVIELALALHEAVRANSGLARDPDNDVSHLQQVVAVDLPATVVSVNRMGDLSKLVDEGDARERSLLTPQFGAAVLAVNSNVGRLTDNLQAAVDDTTSTTLSSSLVAALDSFRLGVEALTRGANPGGSPNGATMATAQSQLQISLANLATIAIREMTGLLGVRLDELGGRGVEALLTAIAAVLLAAGVVVLLLAPAARRGQPAGPPPADAEQPGNRDLTVTPSGRERAGALR